MSLTVAHGGAITNGPFYGDLERAGEFERMVRTVSRGGELVLLHGDFHRLRMLVNLIANLNELRIFHVLLLGFNEETCRRLQKRGRIGCAHSSYLWNEDGTATGALAAARKRWSLAPKYVAWIQKIHYMRRLLERHINVLALDSDVVATANPYPHLHGPFGRFSLITAFDTKGGFANINVGVMYMQNTSVGGPVNGLFVEFERRVALALRMTPPRSMAKRQNLAVKLFWDQNLFNKVLLSNLARRAVYLPDDSDAAWTRSHWTELNLLGRPSRVLSQGKDAPGMQLRHPGSGAAPDSGDGTGWHAPDQHIRTPSSLGVSDPWYPPFADYRWRELAPAAVAAAESQVPG